MSYIRQIQQFDLSKSNYLFFQSTK
uniref:Uncharacterized protein n=1 Tax=Anguilla anguilla TaxID=7936 RepID=A0A0E9UKQ7_ANGAN